VEGSAWGVPSACVQRTSAHDVCASESALVAALVAAGPWARACALGGGTDGAASRPAQPASQAPAPADNSRVAVARLNVAKGIGRTPCCVRQPLLYTSTAWI